MTRIGIPRPGKDAVCEDCLLVYLTPPEAHDDVATHLPHGCIDRLKEELDHLDVGADLLDDPTTIATALLDLASVKRQAGEVYAKYEKALLSVMGERTIDVPSLGRFTAKKTVKRSGWVWDRLVPDLVEKARQERRFNQDSGEVEGEGEATARVLRDCVGFSYAKVTGLKARGLNADEYATVDGEAWSVQLPATEFGK